MTRKAITDPCGVPGCGGKFHGRVKHKGRWVNTCKTCHTRHNRSGNLFITAKMREEDRMRSAVLAEQMRDEDMPLDEIARTLKVSSRTVRRWLADA